MADKDMKWKTLSQKYLIEKPVEKRHIRIHSLTHGTAHQKISRVGDQRHDRHLNIGGSRGNHRKARVLACGRVAECACDHSLNRCHPDIPRHDSQ